jgi:uncharacterized protein YacL
MAQSQGEIERSGSRDAQRARGDSEIPQGAMLVPTTTDEQQAARGVVVRVVRMTFVTLLMTVTLLFILRVDTTRPNSSDSGSFTVVEWWFIPLALALILSACVIGIEVIAPKRIRIISALLFGVLAGLLATFALGFIIDLLARTYEIKSDEMIFAAKVIFGICFCYLGVAIVTRTQDDFRMVIPYVEFAKQVRGPRPMVLDSSALIDGRILELAGTGFIQVPLVVPRFVLAELQKLGDSSDRLVRPRGKRGLDTVARLQRIRSVDVVIDDTPIEGVLVDQRLVELAKMLPGTLVTTDNGLIRVAEIHGVSVLNINELAAALKPTLIPGARVSVLIVKAGEQPGQGVGYLDDGTMVVVEGAQSRLGELVPVDVSTSLQTSAGRLIFARPVDAPESGAAADAQGDVRVPQPSVRGLPGAEAGAPASGAGGAAVDGSDRVSGDEAGAAAEVESDVVGGGGEPGITNPLRVRPPQGEPIKPSPYPPERGPRNPNRNPRR